MAIIRYFVPILFILRYSQAQVFLNEPNSQIVPRGSTADVIFACRAGNDISNPTYSWRKDGGELSLEGSYQTYPGSGDLHISNPQDRDQGTYQCIITCDQGIVASNEAKLYFEYLDEYNTPTTSQRQVTQGMGITLQCGDISFYPEYTTYYMWEEVNSLQRIGPKGNSTHYVSQKNGNLYLANPEPINNGRYQCGARSMWQVGNKYASTTADITELTVYGQDANTPPEFLITPDDETRVGLNEPTYIECFASGNPTPTITWARKDGSNMPLLIKITSSGQLFFSSANSNCEGTYVCTATNDQGSITAEGSLVLEYPPVWREEIQSEWADLTSTVTWTCSASAVPEPTYTWWKNGVQLLPGEDSTVHIEFVGSYTTLTITDLEESHQGMYQCAAKNKDGNKISSAQLTVNSYKPAIDPIPSLTYGALGWEVSIPCTHVAAPAANISWYKNDLDRIVVGEKYTINSDASLTIGFLVDTDEGAYTCEATNQLGTDSSTGSLRTVLPTIMVTNPKNVTSLIAGGSDELYCEVTHDPSITVEWIWTHDGNEIRPFIDDAYFMEGGQLTIKKASSQESGTYVCCAKTSVSTPCGSAVVTVTAPPEAPFDVSITSSSSKSQDVSWSAPFDNHSPVSHYVVEKQNSFSNGWTLANTKPLYINSTSCRVVKLNPYNDYEYRVYAVNAIGRGEPSKPSSVVPTLKGPPAKSPSRLGGGGGGVGELRVTWEPLPVEYYGSDEISYVLAIQRRPADQGVILPIPLEPVAEDNNATSVEKPIEPENPWLQTTIFNNTEDHYIFQVNQSEIYTPYNVKIRADNDLGEGPWSRIKIVRTGEKAPEMTPNNLRLTASGAEAYKAGLIWDALISQNGYIQGYYVKLEQKTGGDGNPIIKKTKSALPGIVIDGLSANMIYQASVSAYNSAGQGPYSQAITFNTEKKPPSKAPSDVKVSISGTVLSTSWKPLQESDMSNDEATLKGYKVEYWFSKKTSKSAIIHKTPGNSMEFSVPDNSQFNVHVRAYSKGGDGPPSQIYYISTGSASHAGQTGGHATAVTGSTTLILLVSLLWVLFVKLDL